MVIDDNFEKLIALLSYLLYGHIYMANRNAKVCLEYRPYSQTLLAIIS